MNCLSHGSHFALPTDIAAQPSWANPGLNEYPSTSKSLSFPATSMKAIAVKNTPGLLLA
ncbi:MAG: hypothetical protein ACYT04_33155 [Nostoc sp.]